ncbi:MAG: GTP-binding protein [Candidatus Hodarchaeales archaeon]|jgi:small GTP-binding protein
MSPSSSEIPLVDYFKVVFLGSNGVGKTSIIHWILGLAPLDEYLPTVGVRFYNLDTVLNGNQYFLQFNDVSGSKSYSNLLPSLLKAAAVAIIVFDYGNKESQHEIQMMYSNVCEYLSSSRILLVGNKFEREKKEIPKTIASWTKTQGLAIFPISVRENIGKSILLQNIGRIITDQSAEDS